MKVVWSVYLARSDHGGEPLLPLRMRCKDEAEARREFSKHGAVEIGKETVFTKEEWEASIA